MNCERTSPPSLATANANCDIGANGHRSSLPCHVPSTTAPSTARLTTARPASPQPDTPERMADMLAPDARLRAMNTLPAPRPVLVFDGDCGFCTTTARLLQRLVERGGRDFAVAPWQELDLGALGLTAQSCLTAAQWVGRDGTVRAGHLSIAAALRAGRPVWRPVGVVLTLPGISALAARVYQWVADHRYALPGGTPACGLPPAGGNDGAAA